MKFANFIRRSAHRAGKFLKRNSSTIMSVTACVGVVGTAVTAVRGYNKAQKELEELEYQETKAIDRVKVITRNYALPVTLGTITCGLIIGSNVIDKRQQASLIAGYAALDQTYRKYRAKVSELVNDGEGNPDAEIKKSIANEKLSKVGPRTSADQMLFYEENSEQFFWSTMEEVREAEYWLNRQFAGLWEATLNDLCASLGIPSCEFGDALGWNMYDGDSHFGYKWIDFDHLWVDENDFPDIPEVLTGDEELFADIPGYWIIRTPIPPHVPIDYV